MARRRTLLSKRQPITDRSDSFTSVVRRNGERSREHVPNSEERLRIKLADLDYQRFDSKFNTRRPTDK